MKKVIPILILVLIFSCDNSKTDSMNSFEIKPHNISNFNYRSHIGKDFLIDDQHSYIGFKIKYFGYSPVRGRFNDFEGTIFYNESDISSLSVSLFIDVNSINTGNEQRDEDLISEDSWFDEPKYPKISFRSKKVTEKPEGLFVLTGNFTMKGVTKEVAIPFEKPTKISLDYGGEEQVDFSGKFTINRQDFGIFGGDFWSTFMEKGVTQLSDEVEIEIDIHTRRADYQKRYDDWEVSNVRKLVLDNIKLNGIDSGITLIDSLQKVGEISAGILSTIGYSLNTWGMYENALSIFEKRKMLFPEKASTWNQVGITNLYLNNFEEAEESFGTTLTKDSINSRAIEYLRLIDLIEEAEK
ncbi:MAG: YceI family protein [Calditrichia bacterium]